MFGKRETSGSVRVDESASPARAAAAKPPAGGSPAPRAANTAPPATAQKTGAPQPPPSPHRNTPLAPPNPNPAAAGNPRPTHTPPPRPPQSRAAAAGNSPAPVMPARSNEARVLNVGKNIKLKGQIEACDQLIVEGKVEAEVANASRLEIHPDGTLSGNAVVESASISGSFQGDIKVKDLLVIQAGGSVSGQITCGELEVERGGRVDGQIAFSSGGSGGGA